MLYRDIKHKAAAECFGSDKVRAASFVNVLYDKPLYMQIPYESFSILCFLRQKNILWRIQGEFQDKAHVYITCTDTTQLRFSFVFSS